MSKIPLVDLKRQYLTIKPEIDEAIQKVVDETAFISGKYASEFEKNFATACGAKFAIGTSSGTTSLYLALVALGVGKGDEVITVPNTFIATTEAISQTGARVVFVDIDEKTYNMDPVKLEEAITDKTKAIVPVHLYGQPVDMEAILNIAKKRNIFVVEDACQAHLAEFNGKKAGSMGDVGCFSFYPGKNLGAYGDGGCVTTNDEQLAAKMRMLSDHGRVSKYEYTMEGYNYRLDGIQAAILDVKLKYLNEWTEKRRAIAELYSTLLKDVDGVITPYIDPRAKHVYHLYVIRIPQREKVKDALAEKNIFAGIHYPIPLHVQKAYDYLGYNKGDFPVSEKCAEEILSLPIFPELSKEDAEQIVVAVKEILKNL